MKHRQPLNPLGYMPLSHASKTAIKILFALIRKSEIWQYPMKTEGDFKTMNILDKVYWLYKSIHPVQHAEKNSCLESFFSKSRKRTPESFPTGFEPKYGIRMSAAGDLMTMHGLENSRDYLYEKVSEILFDTDICLANLESQLTRHHRKVIAIKKNESVSINLSFPEFQALKDHRGKTYSVLNLANNHTFDMGLEGIQTTKSHLTQNGIEYCGVNATKEDQAKATIIRRNSIRLGLIGATFSLNGRELPKNRDYLVNQVAFNRLEKPVDLTLIREQIAYCRQQECDFIIGTFHWGLEHDFFPSQRQVAVAHAIIEEGVDLILGHHPHVIQPVEYYQTRRDPHRIAPICYSLGNLTTPMSAPYLTVSTIINTSIVKGVIDGKNRTYLTDFRIIPVVCRETVHHGHPAVQLERLSTLTAGNGAAKEDPQVQEACNYADLALGEGWRSA